MSWVMLKQCDSCPIRQSVGLMQLNFARSLFKGMSQTGSLSRGVQAATHVKFPLPGWGSEAGTEQFIKDFISEMSCPEWPWGCHLEREGGRCG